MKAQFVVVEHDSKHNIVFLEDLANLTGGRTITNDAGAVFSYWAEVYGNDVRVVYRDTDNEWWEIVPGGPYGLQITFNPWYGKVWDRLTKVES